MINLRAEIVLATPGSAVRLVSVDRHVTDCATRPGLSLSDFCCIFLPVTWPHRESDDVSMKLYSHKQSLPH